MGSGALGLRPATIAVSICPPAFMHAKICVPVDGVVHEGVRPKISVRGTALTFEFRQCVHILATDTNALVTKKTAQQARPALVDIKLCVTCVHPT